MTCDLLFDLFQDGEDGPLWRRSFADLDGAKRNARRLADEERQEFFVRRFEDSSEIARVFPSRMKPQSRPGRRFCAPQISSPHRWTLPFGAIISRREREG
jgi:hypothetical protein